MYQSILKQEDNIFKYSVLLKSKGTATIIFKFVAFEIYACIFIGKSTNTINVNVSALDKT